MNTPEKIINTYFRLNGFFLLPQFTMFANDHHNHIDLLALRSPGCQEICGGAPLPIDIRLFECVSNLINKDALQSLVGLIAEIKGNAQIERPQEDHIEYAKCFFGPEVEAVPISISMKYDLLSIDDGYILIPLEYALGWILYRFRWMDQHLQRLSKTGSWNWSEEALEELLYLQKIGFSELDLRAADQLNS